MARRSGSAHISGRNEILVVTRYADPPKRPVGENRTPEDCIAGHRPKVAAVLREAAIVAEDEVLVVAETGLWEGVSPNVVRFPAVDEDAAFATDDRITRYPYHSLADIEIPCVRVGYDRPAELATSAEGGYLSAVWVAKAVGESLGEPAPITAGDRWGHARGTDRPPQDDEARPREHRDQSNDRHDRHDWNDDALPAKARCRAHQVASLRSTTWFARSGDEAHQGSDAQAPPPERLRGGGGTDSSVIVAGVQNDHRGCGSRSWLSGG